MVNSFDAQIISFMNRYAGRSWAFDEFMHQLGSNYMLKTGLIMALLYWAWFRPVDERTDHRPTVLFGLIASCCGVLVARILSVAIVFRERPLRNPDLHFVLPQGIDRGAIIGWSSFPSDNATLFFGVAMCLFLVSRRAGIVAFIHTFVVVAIARVYFGYHYPTDILAGAILGIGLVSLIHLARVKAAVTRLPLLWMNHHPQSFQTALCVLIFLVATTFEPLYPLSHFILTVTKPALHALDARMLSGVAFIAVVLLVSFSVWVFERALAVKRAWEKAGPLWASKLPERARMAAHLDSPASARGSRHTIPAQPDSLRAIDVFENGGERETDKADTPS